MMADLLHVYAGNWTHHHHLRRHAEKLGLSHHVNINPIVEALFPSREYDDWSRARERQQAAADKLAAELCRKDPDVVAELLTEIEGQARIANISSLSWDGHVCMRIAETTDQPVLWTSALFNRGAPPHLVEPFLEKLALADALQAETWISRVLDVSDLRVLGVCLAIRHYRPTAPIWLKASAYFKDCTQPIGGNVLRDKFSLENSKALLRFPEPTVAASVATHLWRRNAMPRIPDEILPDWKNVVVNCEVEERFGEHL